MKKDKQFSIRISTQDLETIRRKAAQAHMSQSDYVTANEIAEGTGLAYQTVYRYLQHLVQDKKVERLDVYGKVGRPKQVFRRL